MGREVSSDDIITKKVNSIETITKEAITFGDDNELVGVYQQVTEAVVKDKLLCVVMLNAGLSHHIGPFQMNVRLANALTEIGFASFRFDLSGIGDSDRDSRSSRTVEEQHLSDMKAALNYLQEKKGHKQFIVMGSCTGADNAHRLAAADERVVGAIFLDGYAYPTTKYYVLRLLPILLSPSRLFGAAKRELMKVLGLDYHNTPMREEQYNADDLEFTWSHPSKDQVAREYANFVSRGVKLFFVFSGGVTNYFLYPGQISDAFRSLNMKKITTVCHISQADHVYVLVDHRNILIENILQWISKEFE